MQLEGEENSHADRLTLKISLARCNQASCFIVFGEGAAVAAVAVLLFWPIPKFNSE